MNEAIITAVAGVLVCIISTISSNIHTRNLITYRIEQLEAKVNKHNNIIERTFSLETHEKVLDEQIRHLNHEIEDIERRIK